MFSKIEIFSALRHIEFRNNEECPITQEIFKEEMEKLGCSKCKNLFSKKALERWFLIQNYKCPLKCENPKFYEI